MQRFFLFFFTLQIHPFFFNVGLCLKNKKENMQHMTSGTHTINRSHQPCVDVTPPGSSPSHRAGLEPGMDHGCNILSAASAPVALFWVPASREV